MTQQSLNDYRDECFAIAEEHGFHERTMNLGERLMLIVSELGEALEADRVGKSVTWNSKNFPIDLQQDPDIFKGQYNQHIKGSLQEEIADALIRLFDLAGILNIDLDYHVRLKMQYNHYRPRLHGKSYG